MAAGKTTVGGLLAERIGYRFVDLDREVERLAGRSIPDIFRDGGEPAFRRLEARATALLGDEPGVVVAAGGGWMARRELRGRWPNAIRVWLEVDAAEAVRRSGDAPGARPLLEAADPVEAARRLLAVRKPDYARAELSVDTRGKEPGQIAEEIVGRLSALGDADGT